MHKGPVTVIATEYGTRLDNQAVSRSATVGGESVTFDYDEADRFVTISRYASLDGSQLVAISDSEYDEYARPIALVHHMEPMAPFAEYTWRSEGGGNPVEVVHADAASGSGSKSGSGSGCGSGSGSGTTEPGWRLTMVTESGISLGQRMLDYSYSGSGSSWAEWGDDDEGSESSSQWQAERSISQQSTSTRTLATTTSYTDGQPSTTGGQARSVSAFGGATTAYSSQSSGGSWSDGYTHTSNDTTQNTTGDSYDYQYEWEEIYNPDGTTSTSETSSNNVSGSGSGSSTHNWSWSYEGSCGSGSGSGGASGSGCGSGSGSSGTSSSNWSNSYDETVSYPGFYSGAYYSSYGYGSGGGYAGDEPLDYIGDDFSYSSGSGYASYGAGFLASHEGGNGTALSWLNETMHTNLVAELHSGAPSFICNEDPVLVYICGVAVEHNATSARPSLAVGPSASITADQSGANIIFVASDSVSRSILNAIKQGNVGLLKDLLSSGGLSAAQRATVQAAIKKLESTAAQIIAAERKGSIMREFPRQFLQMRYKDILELARKGSAEARRALKLLNDGRFKKPPSPST